LNFFKRIFSRGPARVSVSDLGTYDPLQEALTRFVDEDWTGEKFFGGFGDTKLLQMDYWSLRARSAQLFRQNLYGRGIVRRLVTNEINTGLTPEATPEEVVLGMPAGALAEWTEDVENRFRLWSEAPELCDYRGESTFGQLQQAGRLEALISGDVLKVERRSKKYGTNQTMLIDGAAVRTPMMGNYRIPAGNTIQHGVERTAGGKLVGYWVLQEDGTSKRILAYGPRTGRRVARLVFGTDKRHDDERGEPLLSILLQSMIELDRYRDAATRKALVNSMVAVFIEKTQDKPGSLPVRGGATRRDTVTTTDGKSGGTRKFDLTSHVPGLVIEELQHGEKPVGFDSRGIDVQFGPFEEAISAAMAWACEVPPEIMRLAFSNNYSASQAAINEFRAYINKIWYNFGAAFCTPSYTEFLINEVLAGRIKAPGLLADMRTPARVYEHRAWLMAEWYGSIKPSTDIVKQGKGSKILIDEGLSTRAREARVTTGTKFSKNVDRLGRENSALAAAARPLLELEKDFGSGAAARAAAMLGDAGDKLDELLDREN